MPRAVDGNRPDAPGDLSCSAVRMKPVAVPIVAGALGGGAFARAARRRTRRTISSGVTRSPCPGEPAQCYIHRPPPIRDGRSRASASGARPRSPASSPARRSSMPRRGYPAGRRGTGPPQSRPDRRTGSGTTTKGRGGSSLRITGGGRTRSRRITAVGCSRAPRALRRASSGERPMAMGAGAEPPPTDPDCDAADNDDLEWVFELIGTLLDDALDWGVLTGGAAHTASVATRRLREGRGVGHGNGSSRVGPPRKAVAEARSALSSYVAAHPGAAKPSSSEARFTGRTDRHHGASSVHGDLRTDDERRAVPVRVRSRGDAEAAVGGVSRACGRSGRGGIERASLVQLGVCRVERARVERLVGAVGELGRRRRRLRGGRLLGPRFVGAHFVRLLVGVQLVIALVERRRRVRRARRSGPHGRRSQVGSGRRRTVRCARSA